jgi:hypothetical protein
MSRLYEALRGDALVAPPIRGTRWPVVKPDDVVATLGYSVWRAPLRPADRGALVVALLVALVLAAWRG